MTDADQNSDPRAATGRAPGGRADDGAIASSPPTLRLQAALDPRTFTGCRVEELFAFHDRAFVESAFVAALGRAPGEGEMRATLADLRAGRRDKREIVADLCASEEGARVGARARVAGVGTQSWSRRVRRAPVVGYLWRLISALARLPTALRHQREFETYALAQQQLIADFVNEQQWRQDVHADLRAAVADAHEAVSMLSDAVATLDARQAEERVHLEALIAGQRRVLEGQQSALEEQRRVLEGQRHRLDAQEEFSIREQHAVVEAQKAALAEIESRLFEAEGERRRALEELSLRVEELRRALEEARPGVAHEA